MTGRDYLPSDSSIREELLPSNPNNPHQAVIHLEVELCEMKAGEHHVLERQKKLLAIPGVNKPLCIQRLNEFLASLADWEKPC